MERIPFSKVHGLGNDFLIIRQSRGLGLSPHALAVSVCDRHTGIGADGLVILGPAQNADATFRIYNSDGSEASLSGNALRCAAAWLLFEKFQDSGAPLQPDLPVTLDTRVGLRRLFFLRRERDAWIFRTEIGKPGFAAEDIPFRPPAAVAEPIINYPLPVGDATYSATILSTGNPQCILIGDDWEDKDWKRLGAALERHSYFPDRANIDFVEIVNANTIRARFWERGAGYTLASGTGSCACAVAAHLAGTCERRVRVCLERGELEVNWREDGMVELTGPAVIVATGEYFSQAAAE
jgi:diaminopimelate epimerase